MTATKAPRIRALAYIRISELGERKEGEDLISDKSQLAEMRGHAKRFGYEVVEVMSDLDKTGRDFNKRQVAKIIEMVKAGEIDVVLLWKWSRWGRNLTQSLMYIAQLEAAGGRVEAATEHFDARTSYGKFGRTVFLALAELQSDQIGEGWKETFAYRRTFGLPHTAAPRFGYTYVKIDGEIPRYEKVQPDADELASAYRRYVAGTATFRSLSIEWNDKGVKTTGGRKWSDSSVRAMMDTGFAAGVIRERKDQPLAGRPNKRKLSDFDDWYKGSHEAVIDLALWETYKAKRIGNEGSAPRNIAPKYALTGVLVCRLCGQTLKTHRSGNGGNFHQWVCRNGRDRRHAAVTISNIRAMKLVREWLVENATGGETVTEDAQRIADEMVAVQREADDLEGELRVAQRKLAKLNDGWLNDDFDRDYYDAKKAELGKVVDELRERIAASAARDGRAQVRPEVAQFRELDARWDQYAALHQRAALLALISGVVVVSSKDLRLVPRWF